MNSDARELARQVSAARAELEAIEAELNAQRAKFAALLNEPDVRRAAVKFLLSDPDSIPDDLEVSLYAYQRQLEGLLPSLLEAK